MIIYDGAHPHGIVLTPRSVTNLPSECITRPMTAEEIAAYGPPVGRRKPKTKAKPSPWNQWGGGDASFEDLREMLRMSYEDSGLTMQEFGDKVGINVTSLKDYITGASSPKKGNRRKIEVFLGIVKED